MAAPRLVTALAARLWPAVATRAGSDASVHRLWHVGDSALELSIGRRGVSFTVGAWEESFAETVGLH